MPSTFKTRNPWFTVTTPTKILFVHKDFSPHNLELHSSHSCWKNLLCRKIEHFPRKLLCAQGPTELFRTITDSLNLVNQQFRPCHKNKIPIPLDLSSTVQPTRAKKKPPTENIDTGSNLLRASPPVVPRALKPAFRAPVHQEHAAPTTFYSGRISQCLHKLGEALKRGQPLACLPKPL